MKQRVLFVDDEPRVLEGLRRMLWTMRGEWDMEFVTSGADALAALDRSRYDVVVTDMRMPVMTGAELLTIVRERHPEVVRLILSGQASEEASIKSVGPAHQFLAKPCEAETLKSTIRRTCALRALLNSETLQNLVSKIDSLPSLPKRCLDLLAEVEGHDPSMRRVADLISGDPAMSAKVLQLVNSAFFGIQRQVSDPMQAAMMLGLHTVTVLALSVQVFSTYRNVSAAVKVGDIMSHCLGTAGYARAIGSRLTADSKTLEDCCAAGLLHDTGKLVLATTLGERYAEVLAHAASSGSPVAEAERELLGASHAEVGGYLLGLWGLPDSIVEAVAYHHTPRSIDGSVPLIAVHVADVLQHDLDPALTGVRASLSEDDLREWGLLGEVSAWRAQAGARAEA
jgi:HD-like signal output (HDOD) protein/CheY-like chemotaxis protein